jgi:hypothetical protein
MLQATNRWRVLEEEVVAEVLRVAALTTQELAVVVDPVVDLA